MVEDVRHLIGVAEGQSGILHPLGGLQCGHGGVGLVPGRLMPQSLTSNFNITVVQVVGVAMVPMGVMMVVMVASVGAHGGRLDQVGVAFRRAVAGAVVHHDLLAARHVLDVCDCGHVAVHDVRLVHGEHILA